jgi:hypothetical protein
MPHAWDVTVVDTLAASYVQQSAINAASAAEIAASRKEAKYSTLSHSYRFFPVAIETLGPLSASSQIFLSEIGRRIAQRTSDPRETAFLFQRISVAIQRFNAVCLANTFELADAYLGCRVVAAECVSLGKIDDDSIIYNIN